MISPSLILMMSPGTRMAASSSVQLPFRRTLAFGARRAMSAAAALPALFSSMKLIVELISSSVMIPTKSCQSVLTPPLANAMAMIAAASMTHDSGFHMNPKNLRNLLSSFSSSLFGPKSCRRSCASSEVSPCRQHFKFWNTSSIGMFSFDRLLEDGIEASLVLRHG
ncbi:Os03g0689350, partial [Oryza sativa Japonica Group]